MAKKQANDSLIIKELHNVPKERWSEVLAFIRSLQHQSATTDRPIVSGADLVGSDLIGIWAKRADIGNTQEYARQLRHQAEHRRNSSDAAGH